jgi:hypothetical protein
LENRRHPRLYLTLPIRFVVEQPETKEAQAGQGVSKNISHGGILFRVEPPLPMQPGHVRDFSFFLVPDQQQQCELSHLEAQGLVLRIEPPDPNSSAYGVAVQFLSALKMQDVTLKVTVSPRRRVGLPPTATRRDPLKGPK